MALWVHGTVLCRGCCRASMRCETSFTAGIQRRLSQALLGTAHGRAGVCKPHLLAPLPTPLLTYSARDQILMALGHLKAQEDI